MKNFIYVGYVTIVLSAVYLSYLFIHAPTKFDMPDDGSTMSGYTFMSSIVKDTKSGGIIANTGTGDNFIKVDPMYGDVSLAVGQKISLMKYSTEDKQIEYSFVNLYFLDGLIFIILIFIGSVLLIAKFKGLNALISVFVSLVLFYTIFISMIKMGCNPMWAAFIYMLYIVLLTVPIVHGFNFKSLATLITVFIGYGVSILIAQIFLYITKVTVIPYEEFKNLSVQLPDIDIYNVIMAVIFIGLGGALIDTVISIVSAVYEYTISTVSKINFKGAYKVGMAVGTDVLGSMTNTLLLAFIASSVPFFIILSVYKNSSFVEILNYDIVAFEMTRIFISGVVLALITPISAIIISYILKKFLIK